MALKNNWVKSVWGGCGEGGVLLAEINLNLKAQTVTPCPQKTSQMPGAGSTCFKRWMRIWRWDLSSHALLTLAVFIAVMWEGFLEEVAFRLTFEVGLPFGKAVFSGEDSCTKS